MKIEVNGECAEKNGSLRLKVVESGRQRCGTLY